MGARILVVDDSPTIRKVVASILEARSFETITAEDGQDALDKLSEGPVDLVLLDFVMPRMNGYQFCRELRADPERKHVPVVLMSAKGDKIRGQFVQQTGAIDAITKPFDARGLIAVVEGALKRQEEGRARPVPDPDTMPDEETIADSLRPSSVTPSEDPAIRRAQASQGFGEAIAKLVLPAIQEIPGVEASTDELATAIQRTVTPESMGALTSLLRALDFGENTLEVLAGDISVISIAEILQLLHLQRQSGGLVIANKKSEITLFVREGNIDLASSRGVRDEFLFGRYLLESGVIRREDLDRVLLQRAGTTRLLGEMLTEAGLVGEEDITRALERQTSELVYEVVRWKTGRFSFTVGPPTMEASTAKLGLSTSALVMEGFRRVDEWRLIEGTFDFEEVLYRDQGAIDRIGDESKLTSREQGVLSAIDGDRTVREVVDFMRGSSFEVCKIIYQFLNSRLVKRRAAA
jgi:CheY-like chemotaxis protein